MQGETESFKWRWKCTWGPSNWAASLACGKCSVVLLSRVVIVAVMNKMCIHFKHFWHYPGVRQREVLQLKC